MSSKFMEKWDKANKDFKLPQGTDNLKKLTSVVESLLVDQLPKIIDGEIVDRQEKLEKGLSETKEKLSEIYKALEIQK
jgi:PII-like signaling protein